MGCFLPFESGQVGRSTRNGNKAVLGLPYAYSRNICIKIYEISEDSSNASASQALRIWVTGESKSGLGQLNSKIRTRLLNFYINYRRIP